MSGGWGIEEERGGGGKDKDAKERAKGISVLLLFPTVV